MLLVGISAVLQLVLDVQVVVCDPHVGYIDAVIADAVGLFGRHEIDVFCEDILYMVDLGIVAVSYTHLDVYKRQPGNHEI